VKYFVTLSLAALIAAAPAASFACDGAKAKQASAEKSASASVVPAADVKVVENAPKAAHCADGVKTAKADCPPCDACPGDSKTSTTSAAAPTALPAATAEKIAGKESCGPKACSSKAEAAPATPETKKKTS